jgi:hypothetical protein
MSQFDCSFVWQLATVLIEERSEEARGLYRAQAQREYIVNTARRD